MKSKTYNLTAVVTVADDGGSSGRIRQDLDMIAPGDLRNCLVAMADKEGLMEKLLTIASAGSVTYRDIASAIFLLLHLVKYWAMPEEPWMRPVRFLKIRGNVIPSSAETILLNAEMTDGTVVQGESQIPLVKGKISGSLRRRQNRKP